MSNNTLDHAFQNALAGVSPSSEHEIRTQESFVDEHMSQTEETKVTATEEKEEKEDTNAVVSGANGSDSRCEETWATASTIEAPEPKPNPEPGPEPEPMPEPEPTPEPKPKPRPKKHKNDLPLKLWKATRNYTMNVRRLLAASGLEMTERRKLLRYCTQLIDERTAPWQENAGFPYWARVFDVVSTNIKTLDDLLAIETEEQGELTAEAVDFMISTMHLRVTHLARTAIARFGPYPWTTPHDKCDGCEEPVDLS